MRKQFRSIFILTAISAVMIYIFKLPVYCYKNENNKKTHVDQKNLVKKYNFSQKYSLFRIIFCLIFIYLIYLNRRSPRFRTLMYIIKGFLLINLAYLIYKFILLIYFAYYFFSKPLAILLVCYGIYGLFRLFAIWKEGDSNPRYPIKIYTLSRRAL